MKNCTQIRSFLYFYLLRATRELQGRGVFPNHSKTSMVRYVFVPFIHLPVHQHFTTKSFSSVILNAMSLRKSPIKRSYFVFKDYSLMLCDAV
jgi:hypothetical protein